MKIALFAPFNSPSATSNLSLWEKSWPTKEKYETSQQAAGADVPHRPWAFSLAAVKDLSSFTSASDKLYIVGHCSSGSPTLADRSDGKGQSIFAPKLLSLIETQLHLPLTFPGVIKLLACEGAGGNKHGFLGQLYLVASHKFKQAHFCGYTEVLRVGHQMHKVINTETVKAKITVGAKPGGNEHTGQAGSSVAVWKCPSTTCAHLTKLTGPQEL